MEGEQNQLLPTSVAEPLTGLAAAGREHPGLVTFRAVQLPVPSPACSSVLRRTQEWLRLSVQSCSGKARGEPGLRLSLAAGARRQQPGMLCEGPWSGHLPDASAFWPTSSVMRIMGEGLKLTKVNCNPVEESETGLRGHPHWWGERWVALSLPTVSWAAPRSKGMEVSVHQYRQADGLVARTWGSERIFWVTLWEKPSILHLPHSSHSHVWVAARVRE